MNPVDRVKPYSHGSASKRKFDARPAPARIATEDERTLADQGYVTLRGIESAAGIADIPPISRQQKRFTKEPS